MLVCKIVGPIWLPLLGSKHATASLRSAQLLLAEQGSAFSQSEKRRICPAKRQCVRSSESRQTKERKQKADRLLAICFLLAPPVGLELFGHVYSRKYSRFARLDAMLTLGFKTPYFRNLPSKKDTQSFFSVAYRLRLAQSVRIWILVIVLWV